jgi:hypothetical protein
MGLTRKQGHRHHAEGLWQQPGPDGLLAPNAVFDAPGRPLVTACM